METGTAKPSVSGLLMTGLSRFLRVIPAAAVVFWVSEMVAAEEINPPPVPPVDRLTVIIGARLIDGLGGEPIDDSVVVVRGSKIHSMGRRGEISIPAGASQIKANGLSLLPGLIDSHFHSQFDTNTPVTFELNHGITSFRDPGHPFRFYDPVRATEIPMPRVFLCGGHLDGPPPVWPEQAVLVRDEAHARQAVYEHVDNGASAIKVYFRLPLHHVRAACEAAASRGVRVTAHLELVDADDAIRAGVRGIEHVTSFGTVLAGPANATRFRDAVRADSSARRELRHWLWSTIDLEENPALQPLLDLMLDKGVFVSPTLAIFERRAGVDGGTAEQEHAFDMMKQFIRRCHEAGIPIVVGSHTSAPFAERGRAYQRELELLIDCGLSPMEAIVAGTRQNARFFDVADGLGTIEPGKRADLVLVGGDPSADIGAMRDVRLVMLNGYIRLNSMTGPAGNGP